MLQQFFLTLFFSTIGTSAADFQGSILTIETEKPAFSLDSATLKPVKNPTYIAPVIHASSALAFDIGSETILYEKNIHEPRNMGSITKLMTAMVILDNHGLDEIVTISLDPNQIAGSKVWLYKNEQLTVADLLEAALIPSGNDAAVALATFDAGSEVLFVDKMNKKAEEIGLSQTHFGNSTGFDSFNNVSTAYDIMQLARSALTYDFIKKTVATSEKTIRSHNGKIAHKLETTNELLNNTAYRVKGMKTGTTPGAGPSFVGLIEDDFGHEILTVILNSPDRFQETKVIFEWTVQAYRWPHPLVPLKGGTPIHRKWRRDGTSP
ncbi:MAG: Serine-type D-Ala-D-Ala carboxypeptidase [Candidatus Peregrinibacteria bacterium GW2011_GWA2_47_7]|nr:MAG: Serine-type D-Ala-D-Ala carboxypeptidase [Candidatus Peregrinibacteria bacterium GW2011_GWA2_47_7]